MSAMTKIEIITRREKLEELMERLNDIGINGMTISDVQGHGVQMGHEHYIRNMSADLRAKVKLEIVVCTVPVQDVVDTAMRVLRTGEIGDGKIFVSPVSKVYKVRTGEEDREALL